MKCRTCKHFHFALESLESKCPEDYCDCCNEKYKAYYEKIKNMLCTDINKQEKDGILDPGCGCYNPTDITASMDEMHRLLDELHKELSNKAK